MPRSSVAPTARVPALDRTARRYPPARHRPRSSTGPSVAPDRSSSRGATRRSPAAATGSRSATPRCWSARGASARRWSTAACRPIGRSPSSRTTTSSTSASRCGALWAGIPFVPISPAYSLVSQDYGKLRYIFDSVTPGMLFASGPEYGRADRGSGRRRCRGRARPTASRAAARRPRSRRCSTPCRARPIEDAHARVGPDTVAKFLFTSGSTKNPKGVINTHGMMCANQQMLRQAFAFLADEPPVLVDWLPWNHTFGGNHNVGLVLYNGGTLYIDEGKPTDKGISTTLRNLREISPTIYFNVPKGYEYLAAAMETDEALRRSLFARVRMFMFAGAGLSQAVWDQLDRLAERTVGERIPIFTGLGMTETSPSCTFALRAGKFAPATSACLAPASRSSSCADGDGPLRQDRDPLSRTQRHAGLLARAGVERRGVRRRRLLPHRRRRPLGRPARSRTKGLLFDGRIAEDFKLDTGTFVSVGPLRAKVVAEGAPCIQDVVVTGLNRSEIGVMLFPRLDECRKLAGLPAETDAQTTAGPSEGSGVLPGVVDRLWAGRHRQRHAGRARAPADGPAGDRQGRSHRQGIDQPARRARPPRRAGRGVVPRRHPRAAAAAAALTAAITRRLISSRTSVS